MAYTKRSSNKPADDPGYIPGTSTTYDIHKPWLSLDPWQKKYIETEGNCFLLCGRQSGKSAAMSIKAGLRAVTRPNRNILIVAYTENQAYALFFKVLMFLEANYPKLITRGRDKPTKHIINLKNGSKINCYAAGQAGDGLRHFTLTDLFMDECAPMAKEVFVAVSPMLSIVGGSMDLSSTPRGKEGFFYECSKREDFTKFYISTEDCPRHDKKFLNTAKATMSELEYAQEYLAIFLDELKRVFSEEWLKKVCTIRREENILTGRDYYLGCDLARLGADQSTFEIIRKISKQNLLHVESIVTSKTLTTETEQKIIDLNKMYNFREIYIDAGSGTLGVGIFDHLLNEPSTKNKVVAINNRDRPYDRDELHKTRILKEDLYNNLVGLGERGEIKLLDDDEVILSLKSVQYEYVTKANQPTKLRIFGNYTHIAEGLIRAAFCVKDKRLNIWCR